MKGKKQMFEMYLANAAELVKTGGFLWQGFQ
jgi:hypothetical protein